MIANISEKSVNDLKKKCNCFLDFHFRTSILINRPRKKSTERILLFFKFGKGNFLKKNNACAELKVFGFIIFNFFISLMGTVLLFFILIGNYINETVFVSAYIMHFEEYSIFNTVMEELHRHCIHHKILFSEL